MLGAQLGSFFGLLLYIGASQMTESSELLLPMLAACIFRYATATMLRNAPI